MASLTHEPLARLHRTARGEWVAGVCLAPRVLGAGWWMSDGSKMSKSLGNVIDPFDLIERYGTDPVRFREPRSRTTEHSYLLLQSNRARVLPSLQTPLPPLLCCSPWGLDCDIAHPFARFVTLWLTRSHSGATAISATRSSFSLSIASWPMSSVRLFRLLHADRSSPAAVRLDGRVETVVCGAQAT